MTNQKDVAATPLQPIVMASVPELTLPKPYFEKDGITIYHGDCREILPTVRNAAVMLTDPPYGIEYKSNRATALNGSPRRNAARFGRDVLETDWMPLAAEAMSDESFAFVFTRWDVLHEWKRAMTEAGLKVVQRLIWDKAHWKMGDLAYYGSQIEDVLFAVRGRPEMQWEKRSGNYFRSSSAFLREGQLDHPTQKPESILRRFASDTCRDGLVLDPFMGSGSTLRAAKDCGLRAIGIEIEEKYCEIAAKRLAQGVLF